MPLINLIVFIVGIIIAILITAGFLKGKKIKIGKAEITEEIEKKVVSNTRISEREIIKRQIHIARAVCANFKAHVPNYKNYNESVIENICYKVSDEIEDLILFNHLSLDDNYINSRFPLIWSVIENNVNSNFKEEDCRLLKDSTYRDFRKLIEILLNVRKENE